MKTVIKMTPVTPYDIQGLETWLEEQANAGLLPTKVGGDFTRFRREPSAPGTRFRLEAANGHEFPDPDQLELYRQAGWDYLCTISKFCFLFSAAGPGAPEPHTDPVTRGISLEWLARRTRRALQIVRVGRAAILLLLLLGIFLVWHVHPRRFPLLLVELTGTALLYLLWLFWFWRQQEGEARRLLEFQRSLELGILPAPKRTASNRLFWPVTLAMLALLLGGMIYERPIPLEGFSRPYLHLQDLESEPLTDYETLFGEAPRWEQDDNTVTRQFSLLSPSWYTVNQNLFSRTPGNRKNACSIEDDPAYRYSPDLEAVYFHLAIPALGRTITMSQLAQMELVNLTWEYEELSCPGLDFVLVARAANFPEWQMAAAANGGHAVALLYGGREDLSQHLDALAAALA